MAGEVEKHPSGVAIKVLNVLMKRLRDRNPEDIAKICDDHRNPLQLTVSLSSAGEILDKANRDPRLLLLKK